MNCQRALLICRGRRAPPYSSQKLSMWKVAGVGLTAPALPAPVLSGTPNELMCAGSQPGLPASPARSSG